MTSSSQDLKIFNTTDVLQGLLHFARPACLPAQGPVPPSLQFTTAGLMDLAGGDYMHWEHLLVNDSLSYYEMTWVHQAV